MTQAHFARQPHPIHRQHPPHWALRPLARALGLGMALAPVLGMAQTPSPAPLPATARDAHLLRYDIPAQALADALNAWARRSETPLSVSPALVAGQRSTPLHGQFSAREALQRLLAGTGLAAEFRDGAALVHAAAPVAGQPAGVGAGAGATAASAASSAPDDLAALPPVRTRAGRTASPPPTVQIGLAELQHDRPSDLQDLFKQHASIQVGSALPMSQKLYVGGVEDTQLAVSIDGARQNNKIFHHTAATLIDPALLRAVRVDAGVAAADDGPAALAGAVAYETVHASDLLRPGQQLGGLLSGEYETNGRTGSGSGALFGRRGAWSSLAFVKLADGQVRRDGAGSAITGSSTHLQSGLAKLSYHAASGDRLDISYDSVRDQDQRPYRANLGRITVGRPVALTRAYDLHRQNIAARYSHSAPSAWWDPQAQLSYSVTDLGIHESSQTSDGRTSSLNGRLQNRISGPWGNLTAGLDFYADKATLDYRYLANASLNEQGQERARNSGLYVQGRLTPLPALRLSLGLRADRHQLTGTTGVRYRQRGASYNASGDYQLNQHLGISAGLSDVWGGVPLAENFIINPRWVYPATLPALEADNAFLAVRAQQGPWRLEARVHRTRIDQARTPDYRGGPAGSKNMLAEGVALNLGWQGQHSSAQLRYADTRTRINGLPADSDSGRYLTTPIGKTLSLSASHSVVPQGLTLGADAQLVFALRNTWDIDTNRPAQPLPAYQVVNLFAQWQRVAWPGTTLRAEVSNLLDKRYTSRASYGQEWAYIEPLREPGRSLKLVASHRF